MSLTSNSTLVIGTSVDPVEYRRADGITPRQEEVSSTSAVDASNQDSFKIDDASSLHTLTVKYDPVKVDRRATVRRIARLLSR